MKIHNFIGTEKILNYKCFFFSFSYGINHILVQILLNCLDFLFFLSYKYSIYFAFSFLGSVQKFGREEKMILKKRKVSEKNKKIQVVRVLENSFYLKIKILEFRIIFLNNIINNQKNVITREGDKTKTLSRRNELKE